MLILHKFASSFLLNCFLPNGPNIQIIQGIIQGNDKYYHHSSDHIINEGLYLYSEQIKTMTPTLHEKEEVEQNASDKGGQAYSYSPPDEAVAEAITTLNP